MAAVFGDGTPVYLCTSGTEGVVAEQTHALA